LLKTYEELEEYVKGLGLSYEPLCEDWLGHEIFVARKKGDSEGKVLIAAGAHGDEPAGVYAALELMADAKSNLDLYFLPCRDPVGFNSLSYVLSRLLQVEIYVFSFGDLKGVCKDYGERIYAEWDVYVYRIGDVGLAYSTRCYHDPWAGENYVTEKLSKAAKAGLLDELKGKRVLVPAMLPLSDGVGLFSRVYSLYVTSDGEVVSYNTVRRENVPKEVAAVAELVDRLKPTLTLDLHEGFGEKFYVFVNSKPGAAERKLLMGAFNRLRESKLELLSVEEMEKLMRGMGDREFLEDGVVLSSGEKPTLSLYASKHGASFTFESGLMADLEKRIKMHKLAVIGALEALGEVLE